jgi:hypothetical protein
MSPHKKAFKAYSYCAGRGSAACGEAASNERSASFEARPFGGVVDVKVLESLLVHGQYNPRTG